MVPQKDLYRAVDFKLKENNLMKKINKLSRIVLSGVQIFSFAGMLQAAEPAGYTGQQQAMVPGISPEKAAEDQSGQPDSVPAAPVPMMEPDSPLTPPTETETTAVIPNSESMKPAQEPEHSTAPTVSVPSSTEAETVVTSTTAVNGEENNTFPIGGERERPVSEMSLEEVNTELLRLEMDINDDRDKGDKLFDEIGKLLEKEGEAISERVTAQTNYDLFNARVRQLESDIANFERLLTQNMNTEERDGIHQQLKAAREALKQPKVERDHWEGNLQMRIGEINELRDGQAGLLREVLKTTTRLLDLEDRKRLLEDRRQQLQNPN